MSHEGPAPAVVGGTRLPEAFYARGAAEVAQELLGKRLAVSRGYAHAGGGYLTGRIVETEAYVGEADLACHASRGLTKRTKTLYGPPGTAYVYLIYGIHDLFNVVVAPAGEPQAVLIRAVELDRAGLGTRAGSGPGKLTKALGISRADDASSLVTGRIAVFEGRAPERIGVSERIGVAYAGAWASAPLRFYDAGSPAISGPRSLRV